MMSSVARVKFIKTKVSQTNFHQIRITKSKVIHVQVPVPKWEKTKKWKNIFWVIRGLQIGAGFRNYKSGQEELQIGAALGISNRGKDISNWGRDYKSGQELQTGAEHKLRK